MNRPSRDVTLGLPALALLSTALYMIGRVSAAERTPPITTEDFEFVSGGKRLSGMIDQPATGEARALIVFVHGSGETNVREENRYIDLRRRFAELGIASVVWDKPETQLDWLLERVLQ